MTPDVAMLPPSLERRERCRVQQSHVCGGSAEGYSHKLPRLPLTQIEPRVLGSGSHRLFSSKLSPTVPGGRLTLPMAGDRTRTLAVRIHWEKEYGLRRHPA